MGMSSRAFNWRIWALGLRHLDATNHVAHEYVTNKDRAFACCSQRTYVYYNLRCLVPQQLGSAWIPRFPELLPRFLFTVRYPQTLNQLLVSLFTFNRYSWMIIWVPKCFKKTPQFLRLVKFHALNHVKSPTDEIPNFRRLKSPVFFSR